MKQQIILLYAGQYQIVEEKTGEIKSGVTMNYYFNVDLVAEDNKWIKRHPASEKLR